MIGLTRLQVTVYSMIFVFLLLQFLERFRGILQPLFFAIFLGLMILPVHQWIVRQGIRPLLASVVLLTLVILAFLGLGVMVFRNGETLSNRMPEYGSKIQKRYLSALEWLPEDVRPGVDHFVQESRVLSPDQIAGLITSILGSFVGFLSALVITGIYLIFLGAERSSFHDRVVNALGEQQGQQVLQVIERINAGVAQYMSVKTFASLLGGVTSWILLAVLGVDFAATWAVLIFLLNYIPYLGSLVATLLPIAMAFIQFEDLATPIIVAVGLIAIQQMIGTFLEPRMAGHRLGVSPLLILLSLALWFVVWGVVGAILAVPLLVITKIVLDSIEQTRSMAALMCNAGKS